MTDEFPRMDRSEADEYFDEKRKQHRERDECYEMGNSKPVDKTTSDDTAEVVSMGTSVTVDQPLTDEQRERYETMAQIFEQQFQQFVQKDLDYGSNWLTAAQKELQHDDSVFDTPLETALYKLYTRADDKDGRFYTQAFGDGSNLVHEDLEETSGDAMNYWALMKLAIRLNNE